MENLITNIIGTLGVVIILGTYLLLQTDRLSSDDVRYSVANFVGSGMILLSLWYDFNLPSFIVETAWVIISLLGIIRHRRTRRIQAQP